MAALSLHTVIAFAGGLIVLLQTITQEDEAGWDFYWVWALMISLISSLVCGSLVYMQITGKGDDRLLKLLSLSMVVLWLAGVGPLTVVRPFVSAGNGYFGTWSAFLASGLSASHGKLLFNASLDGVGGSYMAGLLLASMAVLIQTARNCTMLNEWCDGNAAWVLICSAVSSALCGTLLVPQVATMAEPHFRFIALFLLVWWAPGTLVATFQTYELVYANGYFGSWAAFLASAMLLQKSWFPEIDVSLLEGGAVPREILALGLASLITLIAASMHCGDLVCNGLEMWAIVCSSVSFGICFLGGLLHTVHQKTPSDTEIRTLALFLLIWWTLGTGCFCFRKPFHGLGNGYFSSWAALIATCLFATKHVDKLKDAYDQFGSNSKEMMFLLFASVVLLCQSFWDCVDGNLKCQGEWIWAVICSLVSFATCLIVRYAFEKVEQYIKWLRAGIFLWWSVGVLVLTFHRPYVNTGNAYFSCWCAWCASIRLFLAEHLQKQQPKGGNFSILGLELDVPGNFSDVIGNSSSPTCEIASAEPSVVSDGPVENFVIEVPDEPLPRIVGTSSIDIIDKDGELDDTQ